MTTLAILKYVKPNDQFDILISFHFHYFFLTVNIALYLVFRFFNNAYYARVGGVKTCELNRLEMSFLFGIDFRLQVSVDTFHKYCWQLEEEGLETLQIERPMQACRIKESWSNKDDPSCASTIARW